MSFDVFVSYRRRCAQSVRPIVDALRAAGVRVWIDEEDIPAFSAVTKQAQEAIAHSMAMLVYYSRDYRESPACQWELRQAFIAAMGYGDPTQRVLVVNPEPGNDHIEPVTLRDAQHLIGQRAEPDAVAGAVVRQLSTLDGLLGNAASPRVRWLPVEQTSAPRWVGRIDEIWQIHSALWRAESQMTEPGAEGSPCVVVSGFAGIGKTLLAREYALRFAAAYPGGIFSLSAEPDADHAGQLREFARVVLDIGTGASLDELSVQDLADVLRQALARSDPFLWIVDGLPSGTTRDAVQTWLAPTPGRTIITSRGREHAGWAPVVALEPLSGGEAFELLTTRRPAESDAERRAAQAVLDALMGHPLAIDVVGARTRTQSYGDLLAGLTGALQHDPALSLGTLEALPTSHERGVASALRGSIDTLGEEAAEILRLGSALSSEPIPEELLTLALAKCEEAGEDAAAVRRAAGLAELDMYSLVTPAGGRRWLIHRLVSRTMRGISQPSARDQALRAATVEVLADRLGASGLISHETEELVPHARALLEAPRSPMELDLLIAVAGYDLARGAAAEAEAHFRQARTARERLFGAEDRSTLQAVSGVANALARQGETLRARELQEEVLANLRRAYGSEDDDTLAAMAELAESLRNDGEFTHATELHRAVLEVRQRLCHPDDPRVLEAKAALALDLGHGGFPAEAQKLLDDVVEARQRLLGPAHPDTITSMMNLVVSAAIAGDLNRARELAEGVAETSEQTIGTEHPLTLHALSQLAGMEAQARNEQRAHELYDRVIGAMRRVFGPDHPDTIQTEMMQAVLRQMEGESGTARTTLEHALERLVARYGPEHPLALSANSKLATVLANDGDFDGARARLQSVLEIRTRRFGRRNGPTLTVMTLLGQVLAAGGDLKAATKTLKEARRLTRATFGATHPRTLSLTEMLEAVQAERRARRPLDIRFTWR